ncbi:MAG TPA: GAF domain-containing protein, partial [Xanthomonadaceae bacterium]|nr:GAF domain-containing protein [Xanthomonadaceae bacterium]
MSHLLPLPDPAASAAADGDEFAPDRAGELADIVRMAARLADAPIAVLSVTEGDDFRLVATEGIDPGLIARDHAICRALDANQPEIEVPDARADLRFRHDPPVQREGGIRYYCGVALFDPGQRLLGVLSVADVRQRGPAPESV